MVEVGLFYDLSFFIVRLMFFLVDLSNSSYSWGGSHGIVSWSDRSFFLLLLFDCLVLILFKDIFLFFWLWLFYICWLLFLEVRLLLLNFFFLPLRKLLIIFLSYLILRWFPFFDFIFKNRFCSLDIHTSRNKAIVGRKLSNNCIRLEFQLSLIVSWLAWCFRWLKISLRLLLQIADWRACWTYIQRCVIFDSAENILESRYFSWLRIDWSWLVCW